MLAIRVICTLGSVFLPVIAAASSREKAPDQVRMNDGTELRGLILQNTSDMVVIETENGEARLPKDYVRRIDDAPNGEAIFAELVDKDNLPSWRSVVHDLRTHDRIRLFEQIPPTSIDKGLLRHIPYLSFRANETAELNIYGDPDNPVAIEVGLYGSKGPDARTLRLFRELLAGHLHTREQIRALYHLSPRERDARAGRLAFRLIRPDDADGYGGTWIVVYRPESMERARISRRAYQEITRPFGEVNNPDGSLRAEKSQENQSWLERTVERFNGEDPELRGFYRDKNGVFRVLTSDG